MARRLTDTFMKEWNGNNASWRSMLGINKGYNTNEREADDYYTTDPTAVLQFINNLSKYRARLAGGFFDTIWEPACGCGNISKVLIDAGYKVYSTDLFDRGFGVSGVDFLQTTKMPNNCDTIITNPPYMLANEFILHAMDILPIHGRYFALMNLSYLTGQKRHKEIYDKGYLRAIYVYPHRINCYKNNKNTGHSSPVNYAWFEFSPSNAKSIIKFAPFICWIER